MKGDLTWGGEYTIQYTDDILQIHTPETYVILLMNVTPIKLIKKKVKEREIKNACTWKNK